MTCPSGGGLETYITLHWSCEMRERTLNCAGEFGYDADSNDHVPIVIIMLKRRYGYSPMYRQLYIVESCTLTKDARMHGWIGR